MDKTTKASSGLLKSLIYTVVAFAVPVLGYLVPGALSLIAVALVSSAFFAAAFLTKPSPLPLLAPVVSFLAVFFISGHSGFDAAAYTVYLPVGTAMAFCLLKGFDRARTVAVSSVALVSFVGVLGIAAVILLKGTFNAEAIKECFDIFWGSVADTVRTVLYDAKETVVNAYILSGQTPDYYEVIFSDAYIETFIAALKIIVIPTFIFVCEAVVFLSTAICRKLLTLEKAYKEFFAKNNGWLYIAGKSTALVYIIVWFISVVGGDELTIPEYVTFTTVSAAISGGLAVVGCRVVKNWLKNNRGGSFMMLFLLVALFMFFGGFSVAVKLVVVIGLIATLTAKASKGAKA